MKKPPTLKTGRLVNVYGFITCAALALTLFNCGSDPENEVGLYYEGENPLLLKIYSIKLKNRSADLPSLCFLFSIKKSEKRFLFNSFLV